MSAGWVWGGSEWPERSLIYSPLVSTYCFLCPFVTFSTSPFLDTGKSKCFHTSDIKVAGAEGQAYGIDFTPLFTRVSVTHDLEKVMGVKFPSTDSYNSNGMNVCRLNNQ